MANKLKFNENYIEILVDRGDTASVELAGQIPYVHRNRINTVFRTTIRNIDLVLRLFRGIDITVPDSKLSNFLESGPKQVIRLLDKEIRRRIDTKTLIELGPEGVTSNEYITLRMHQQLGLELSRVNDKYAFFYDTRTGKTPMSLQIILEDIELNPHHKWLVLCPLILIENAWLVDAASMFPQLKVVNLHDTSKAKRLAKFKETGNLYISNIESFASYREHIEKLGFHGCIVDESSVMKSASSKFGKEAVDFAWNLKRWYLLSGTPAPNGEWEYYRQLQSVDFYGVHQSWSQFKTYFFDNISHNPQYEKLRVKSDRKDELLGLLREYSLYVDKEDVLDTPGRDFHTVELTMPEDLQEKYLQLKQQLYMELGDEVTITTPSTAASLNKLNQVSSGFAIDTLAMKHNKMVKTARKEGTYIPPEYDIIKEETYFLSDYRFIELMKLLDSLGDKQAIIWCHYHKEFETIKEMLGDRCGLVYGGVNITNKNAAIRDFKSGRIQFLVANPASADKGLTLTNAHNAIYFSFGYSYELWKQSIERIYGDRTKQPLRCQYYIFIAKGTVDRAIYTAVRTKGDLSTAILEHLKGRLVNYEPCQKRENN